jgi:hypothetical protein
LGSSPDSHSDHGVVYNILDKQDVKAGLTAWPGVLRFADRLGKGLRAEEDRGDARDGE